MFCYSKDLLQRFEKGNTHTNVNHKSAAKLGNNYVFENSISFAKLDLQSFYDFSSSIQPFQEIHAVRVEKK